MTDLETLQAENLRLWNENEQLQDANELLAEINVTMKARVVALELALEFYADEANWRYRHDVAAYDDKGQRAREALAKLGSEALQSRGDEISGRVKGE